MSDALKIIGSLGLNVSVAAGVLQPLATPLPLPQVGPEHLRQYMIATKDPGGYYWHEKTPGVIKEARDAFDRGVGEMFQGGAHGITIQYYKPRSTPINRRAYFRERNENE